MDKDICDHHKSIENFKDAIIQNKIKVISTISDLAENLKKNEASNKIPSIQGSDQNLNNGSNSDVDTVDVMPKVMSFTRFDILLNLVSIFCYLIDVVSDIVTCFLHYQTKKIIFFYLTLIFIIVPTMITTFISLRWYIIDSNNKGTPKVSKTRWAIRFIFLSLQMGQIMRYIDSLAFGLKYMNNPNVKYYQFMVHEDTDATMLRLFECFLESAPQLLIQLYLIIMIPIDIKNLSKTNIITQVLFPYFSCCISLFSIALALASYYKSLRMSLPNKVNLSMFEMCVQVIWRLFLIGSRILALTLFITSFSYNIIFVFFIHWAIMFIWILSMKTNFCENNFEEYIYDALIAIMFNFCYFNPIDNDTRNRYAFFFIFMLIENTILLYFWYNDCTYHYNLPCDFKTELITLYYAFFIIGVFIMILYYIYCHPTKNIKVFRTTEDIEKNNLKHIYVSRNEQRRIFDENDWATEAQIKNLIENLNENYTEEECGNFGKVKTLIYKKTS